MLTTSDDDDILLLPHTTNLRPKCLPELPKRGVDLAKKPSAVSAVLVESDPILASSSSSPVKSCAVCRQSLEHLTAELLRLHVNFCLDNQGSAVSLRAKMRKSPSVPCPICKEELPSAGPFRTSHVKRCTREHAIPAKNVLSLLETEPRNPPIKQKRKRAPPPVVRAKKAPRLNNGNSFGQDYTSALSSTINNDEEPLHLSAAAAAASATSSAADVIPDKIVSPQFTRIIDDVAAKGRRRRSYAVVELAPRSCKCDVIQLIQDRFLRRFCVTTTDSAGDSNAFRAVQKRGTNHRIMQRITAQALMLKKLHRFDELSAALRKMTCDGDMDILCTGDVKVRAVSALLAARTSLLPKKQRPGEANSRLETVAVDAPLNAVRAWLVYVYSARVEWSAAGTENDVIRELASKYGPEDLAGVCAEMAKTRNEENCEEIQAEQLNEEGATAAPSNEEESRDRDGEEGAEDNEGELGGRMAVSRVSPAFGDISSPSERDSAREQERGEVAKSERKEDAEEGLKEEEIVMLDSDKEDESPTPTAPSFFLRAPDSYGGAPEENDESTVPRRDTVTSSDTNQQSDSRHYDVRSPVLAAFDKTPLRQGGRISYSPRYYRTSGRDESGSAPKRPSSEALSPTRGSERRQTEMTSPDLFEDFELPPNSIGRSSSSPIVASPVRVDEEQADSSEIVYLCTSQRVSGGENGQTTSPNYMDDDVWDGFDDAQPCFGGACFPSSEVEAEQTSPPAPKSISVSSPGSRSTLSPSGSRLYEDTPSARRSHRIRLRSEQNSIVNEVVACPEKRSGSRRSTCKKNDKTSPGEKAQEQPPNDHDSFYDSFTWTPMLKHQKPAEAPANPSSSKETAGSSSVPASTSPFKTPLTKAAQQAMVLGSGVKVLKYDGITPRPRFETMDEAELKKDLARFGLRAGGKKRSIALLSEIYDRTHPVLTESGELVVATEEAKPTNAKQQKKGTGKQQKKDGETANEPPGKPAKKTVAAKASTSTTSLNSKSVESVREAEKGGGEDEEEEEADLGDKTLNESFSDEDGESGGGAAEESFILPGVLPKDLDGVQATFLQWLRLPENVDLHSHLLSLQSVSLEELFVRVSRADHAICTISRAKLIAILDRLHVTFSLPQERWKRKKQAKEARIKVRAGK